MPPPTGRLPRLLAWGEAHKSVLARMLAEWSQRQADVDSYSGRSDSWRSLEAACDLAIHIRRGRFGDLTPLQKRLAKNDRGSLDLVTLSRLALRMAARGPHELNTLSSTDSCSADYRNSRVLADADSRLRKPLGIILVSWAYRHRRQLSEAIDEWSSSGAVSHQFPSRYFGRSNGRHAWLRAFDQVLPFPYCSHDIALDLSIYLAERLEARKPSLTPELRAALREAKLRNPYRVAQVIIACGVRYGLW